MKDERSNSNGQSPIIVWCVRFCFFALICYFSKSWIQNSSATLMGKLIFGGFIGVSAVAIIVSFIRSKVSLVVMVIAVIAIPLIISLGIGIVVLDSSWWELLIGIPVQIAIPFAVAFYLWKAPACRKFYLLNQSEKQRE